MIPIFDSLSHPTLTGDWMEKNNLSTFKNLFDQLKRNNFIGASAVGIYNTEEYEHEKFIKECNRYNILFPVAGFNLKEVSLKKEILRIKSLGFRAIKIHPRYNNFNFKDPIILGKVFKLAYENDLIVYFCTYHHTHINNYPLKDPFKILIQALKSAPKLKLILVHGGDINLMKYAELTRFNSNLLLDLSLTILKYRGSSIDQDIRFLFKNFDRRICIGTDHPEYSHSLLRETFENFSQGISEDKSVNIANRNIIEFLRIT